MFVWVGFEMRAGAFGLAVQRVRSPTVREGAPRGVASGLIESLLARPSLTVGLLTRYWIAVMHDTIPVVTRSVESSHD